jgi:hypothetical protein
LELMWTTEQCLDQRSATFFFIRGTPWFVRDTWRHGKKFCSRKGSTKLHGRKRVYLWIFQLWEYRGYENKVYNASWIKVSTVKYVCVCVCVRPCLCLYT